MGTYCFGIDVGGTTVKCGLFSTDGTLVEKWEIPTRKENNGDQILPDVAAAVNAKIEERGISKDDVEGVGIGVPGPVNSKGEVYRAVNLYWGYKNVAGEMEELTGLHAKAGNDANVAALGELWQGGGRGYKNMVMITLGTGVGGGIILNEKIWSGMQGVGGEIGHIHVIEGETEQCNCGGYGCLEQAASATGIARLARKLLEADPARPSSLREVKNLSAKSVLDAARAGDPLALESVETSCRYLGWAMAGITMVVDPEAYLIGGGVSRAGTFLTEKIQRYHDQLSTMATKKAKVLLATLGNDAGIYGAAKLVLG